MKYAAKKIVWMLLTMLINLAAALVGSYFRRKQQ